MTAPAATSLPTSAGATTATMPPAVSGEDWQRIDLDFLPGAVAVAGPPMGAGACGRPVATATRTS